MFRDDPTGNLIRQILGNFDEYQSRENAKHTSRAMNENARQGFWNGSIPPFGYNTVVAEQRGSKAKKRLVIAEDEAAIVRWIFDLALGRQGPVMGVKAIVNRLNASGIGFRGKRFQISNVHRILSSQTYAGTHHFNRTRAKTGELKDASEWIAVPVPPIIAQEEFELVQASMAARNPKQIPPRIVSGPTLLTGIARCATCGSGMTIRTGKSGRYRYYVCAGCAQKGKTHCVGRSISMPMLDGMILNHLSDELFTPDRLKVILDAYIARSEDTEATRNRQLAVLKARLTELKGKTSRLLTLVANGSMDADDPQLKDLLADLRAQGHAVTHEIDLLSRALPAGGSVITDARISKLADLMRGALRDENPEFRRAYLRLFVDSISVGDAEIRMSGPRNVLAAAALKSELPNAALAVPSFVRGWRPVGDGSSRLPIIREQLHLKGLRSISCGGNLWGQSVGAVLQNTRDHT